MLEKRKLKSKAIRANLFLEYDGKCFYCTKKLEKGWHTDHVIPWSKGGKTTLENLRPVCPKCNLLKGDKNLDDFLKSERRKNNEL